MLAFALAVAVVLSAAGWLFMALHRGPHIAMPNSIMGIQKIDTPAAQQAIAAIKDRANKIGVEAQAGLYGTSQTQPSIVVLTVISRTSLSPDELMGDFTAGAVDPSNNFKLNLLAVTRSTHDGATFICAPLLAQVNRTVCVWKDDRVLGFVGERDLAVNPMDLTSIIRTAVES